MLPKPERPNRVVSRLTSRPMKIAIAVLSILASTGPVCAQSAYPFAVGQLHADFQLPAIDGEGSISLSDYRGQKVLLVHFASW